MKSICTSSKKICYLGMALGSLACDSAIGQTNTPATTNTNTPPATPTTTPTNVTVLNTTTVIGHLNQARSQILTSVGATAYSINTNQITSESQGANASFNQVILRSPGVAEDSAVNGDLHVRGEHANLQYRIDGVLLPEGIAGFGLELDPRFVQSMQLITGSLPAEYGFRTAGIIDIQTKSGSYEPGGEVGFYGGSYDTFKPYFQLGDTIGKLNLYIDGSYDHNELGIENPVGTSTAIHDETEQFKTFMYRALHYRPVQPPGLHRQRVLQRLPDSGPAGAARRHVAFRRKLWHGIAKPGHAAFGELQFRQRQRKPE